MLVIIITLPFASHHFTPLNLIRFSESLLSTLLFISNYYFWETNQIYGEVSGLLKPMLHTWSLSVEEQFYIFFPLFVYLIFRFFKNYLFYFFVLGFFFSLILAIWASKNYPIFSFYSLPTRGWELLAGSILAHTDLKFERYKFKNSKFNSLFNFIGLSMIIYSFFFFTSDTYHPSIKTLIPVIGTCVIIYFNDPNTIIIKILSSKIFIKIGLISYSLYLWHYPVFALAKSYHFFQTSFFMKLALILLTFTLSILSYIFYEKKFRDRKYSFKKISILLILKFFIIIISSILIVQNYGYKDRMHYVIQDEILNKNQKSFSKIKQTECKPILGGLSCDYKNYNKTKIIVLGDSQMGGLAQVLINEIDFSEYSFLYSYNASCLFLPGFDKINIKTKKVNEYCNKEYFKKIADNYLNEKNSIIILGGRLPLYLSGSFFNNKEGGIEGLSWTEKFDNHSLKSFHETFRTSIKKLSSFNKVVLVYPIPEVGYDVPTLLNLRLKKFISDELNMINLLKKNYLTTS